MTYIEKMKELERRLLKIMEELDIPALVMSVAPTDDPAEEGVLWLPGCKPDCPHPDFCVSQVLAAAAEHLGSVSQDIAAEMAQRDEFTN